MTMPAGYTATPVDFLDQAVFDHDFSVANEDAPAGDIKTSWPMPRDCESDFQVILIAALANYGITDIPVLKNGTFESSKLRVPDPNDPKNPNKGTLVPVISINMSSDVAERTSIGEINYVGEVGDGNVLDGSADGDPTATPPVPPTVPPLLGAQQGQPIALKNQASNVSVAVTIYCLDEELGKNLYLFVKTAMFACQQVFANLGYIKPPLRTSASRSTGVLETDGGQRFLYEWDMVYEAMHYDFIAGIDSLGHLIAIRSNVEPALDPDGFATQTVNLDAP